MISLQILPFQPGDEVFVLERGEDGNYCCYNVYMFLAQVNDFIICTPYINDLTDVAGTLEYHAEKTLEELETPLCVFEAVDCRMTREAVNAALQEQIIEEK